MLEIIKYKKTYPIVDKADWKALDEAAEAYLKKDQGGTEQESSPSQG